MLNYSEKAGNSPSAQSVHTLSSSVLKLLSAFGLFEKSALNLIPKLMDSVCGMDQLVKDSIESGKLNCERGVSYQKAANTVLLSLFEAWVLDDSIAKKFLTDMDGFDFMLNRLFVQGQSPYKTASKSKSRKKREQDSSDEADSDFQSRIRDQLS